MKVWSLAWAALADGNSNTELLRLYYVNKSKDFVKCGGV